jgi:hypothetical protein
MKFSNRLWQLSLVAVLAAGVTAGSVVWNVRADAKAIRESFTVLELRYSRDVPPLLQQLTFLPDVSEEQRAALFELHKTFAALAPTTDLHADIDEFSKNLGALRAIVTGLTSNTVVTEVPAFTALKSLSFAEEQHLKDLFAEYNQEAFLWNQRDRTTAGRLIGSTLQLQKVLMVHPDGATEEQTVVSF